MTGLLIGEIHLVNLDPTVGHEIRKTRPVVVVNSGDAKNLPLAIAVPVTQWRAAWEKNPFFVVLEPSSRNGLSKKSVVDCFQIRAISHVRFIRCLGEIAVPEVDRIKAALSLILDIDPEHCAAFG